MTQLAEARIPHVHIQGYRCLADVAVVLSPLTVLVGRNGSGKSSFVDALAFLSHALTESPEAAFTDRGGAETVITHGRHTLSFQIQIHSREPDQFQGTYTVRFRKHTQTQFEVETEHCLVTMGATGTPQQFRIEQGNWIETVSGLTPPIAPRRLVLPLFAGMAVFAPIHAALKHLSFYNFQPATFRHLREQDPFPIPLASDGHNLASVLNTLRDQDEASFQRVNDFLSAALPNIQAIGLHREGRLLAVEFEETFPRQRLTVPAMSASDGTLRLLAFLTALHQDHAPTLVAIEEPETALHPNVAGVVVDAAQGASYTTQVLITTHNPALIARFEIDDLRAIERDEDGFSVIGPIAENQRTSILDHLFTAGELHQLEGLRPEMGVYA